MRTRKRIAALVLALFLSLSLVQSITEPAAAATNNAYRWLVSFTKSYGQYDTSSKQYAVSLSDEMMDGLFWIVYDDSAKNLYLMYTFSTSYVYLEIDRENFTYANVYSGTIDMYEGRARLYCPGYDAENSFTLNAFSGDPAYRTQSALEMKYEVANILEMIHNLLVLAETGYTIQDFGFRSFSRHNWHKFDDGKVIIEPTCSLDGVCRYTCLICGMTEDRYTSATGNHTWELYGYEVYPTCTESGIGRYRCSVCHGEYKNESVEPLGHKWKLTEILSPTADGAHGTALYTCSRCQETKEDRLCAGVVFTDMPADDYWAHVPIDWAYFSGVTSGKTPTSFAPKASITRAEAVTFLWTLAGRPEPAAAENPFADVGADKYYYKPVLWAVEQGITSGKSETSFAPKAQCSRAEIMTFLWNAAGRPAPELAENPFTDVPEGKYYYDPILWAYEQHVTGGATATTFGPRNVCTRAQVVTFLYKAQDLLRPAAPEPEPEPEPQPEPQPEPEPLPEP